MLELEDQLKKAQAKIRDILTRKASVVLKDQLRELEGLNSQMSLELVSLRDKEEKFV